MHPVSCSRTFELFLQPYPSFAEAPARLRSIAFFECILKQGHPPQKKTSCGNDIHETVYFSLPTAKAPTEFDTVNGSVTYGFVFDCVQVEVDIDTGEVKILDYFTVHDAGRLLNPKIVNGQILGGLLHGIGATMYEDLVYDKQGQLLTGSFMDYIVPTATEMPKVTIKHIETPSPLTPLGAKGLGEGNTMSAPAAISNAVTDALKPFGVSIDKLPVTPNYVWNEIYKKEKVT